MKYPLLCELATNIYESINFRLKNQSDLRYSLLCEQPATNIYGNFKRSHQESKQGLKLNLDPLMLSKENLPHSIHKDKKE